METLFTPWRYSYVSMSDPQEGCFFCRAGTESLAGDNLLVWRDATYLVMLNRYPYTNGHLMIAPLEHLADPSLGDAAAIEEFWPLVLRCRRVLDQVYSPDGFNMGINLGRASGAGVPGHFHFHIVPRWLGDTNFMSVVGRTRLVPEDLSEVVRKLRPLFGAEAD